MNIEDKIFLIDKFIEVNSKLDEIRKDTICKINKETIEECIRMVYQRKPSSKILCIKICRLLTGYDLKKAKEYVEELLNL